MRIFSFFTLVFCVFVIVVSELPIRKGYLNYILKDTQYEKVLWLYYGLVEKEISNDSFDFVLVGSSSGNCGFNDSISEFRSINMCVNNGNRILENFLISSFFANNNTAKIVFNEIHSTNVLNFNYFGIHPMMHYLCTPSWLVVKGHSIFQPHFIKFVINRFQAVVVSWLRFDLIKDYRFFTQKYGVRLKKKCIKKSEIEKHETRRLEVNEQVEISGVLEWYHNRTMGGSFRVKTEALVNANCGQNMVYVYFPLFGRSDSGIMNMNITKLEKKFDLSRIDKSLLYLSNDYIYWADIGHFNQLGSSVATKLFDSLFIELSK